MPPNPHNTAPKSSLSPELKGWLDNVVVPALVREYLAGREREKSACSKPEPVKDSAPIQVSAEGVR